MSGRGLLQSLDPWTKIAAGTAFALVSTLTPAGRPIRLAACFVLLAGLFALSRLSSAMVLKRLALLVPLLLFLVLSLVMFGDVPGERRFAAGAGLSAKAFLVYGGVMMLTLTTDAVDIVRALERARVPSVLTSLLFFALRYLRLLKGDALALKRAVDSRSFGGRGRVKEAALMARLLSLQSLRALDRSQRIHAAMLSRGYAGRLGLPVRSRPGRADLVFGLAFLSGLGLTLVLP